LSVREREREREKFANFDRTFKTFYIFEAVHFPAKFWKIVWISRDKIYLWE